MIAILAALRQRTGQGQRIELTQIESVTATIGPALLDYTASGNSQTRKGNRSSWICPHGIYRCADDPSGRERWIAIAVGHDAHLAERGFYEYLDHPETGISLYDGPIVRLHETPGYLAAPAPLFGEHTYEVATEVLGYSPDEVAELTASGVLS